MKKKLFLLILTVLMAVSMAFGAVGVFGDEVDGEPVVSSPWTHDSSTGKTTATNSADPFYANSASAIYVAEGKTATGDYTVSASFVGTAGCTTAARHDVGILAYYYDANNWISFSVSWWNGYSGGKVTDLLIVECNGGALSYTDHFFDNPTYNYGDFTASYNKAQTDKITLGASKTYDAANGYDVYTFIIDGNEFISKNCGLSASATLKNEPSKFGYVCSAADAAFTFDEVTVSVPGPDGSAQSYSEISGAPAGTQGVGAWTYSDGAYSVSAEEDIYSTHVLASNELKTGNYKIDYTIELSDVTDNSEVLLSGWYVGNNDKILYIVKKSASGWVVEQNGVLSGVAVDSGEAKAITESDGVITLSVEKVGMRAVLKQGDTVLFTCESSELEAGTNYLFGAGNVTAKITPVASVLEYVAYDFYNTTVNGVTYKVSAKDYNNSVVISDTGISMATEQDTATRIIYGADTSGYIDLSATFAGDATSYGMYVWYISENDNVAVVVNGSNVQLIVTAGGETSSKDFTVSEGNVSTLSVTLRGKSVSAYSGDVEIFKDEEISNIDIAVTFNIGFIAQGGSVSVTDISKTGFTAYADRVDGDWIFKGRSYATWQLDGKTVKANCVNGTDWVATNAFKEIDKIPAEGDYAIGFAAQVVGKTNTEWKYGVIPFYIDSANFIFVFISQFAEKGVEIVATGVLNGAAWGETFRYVGVTLDIEETNLIEVRVEGDKISVYLNANYASAFSTTFEGLSEITRDERKSYMGFNVFNTSTNFSQITYKDNVDSRIFADTEAPAIELIGTMPTSGTVNTEIKLATFISNDSSAEVNVSCSFNGNAVEISKNRFTPTEAGDYIVKVTATDLWGNTELKEYTITVKEESSKKGCGGVMVSSSIMLSALGLAAVGFALKKKAH